MIDFHQLLQQIKTGDIKALARLISLIENEYEGYIEFLQSLQNVHTPVIGITGPPGAGKSTLTDALIEKLTEENKKIGVLCIDPTSPFGSGALLGDRIRMNAWYTHPNVFIRSMATRGSTGGLHPKIIEVTDVMKAAGFDHIIIETVGVGQTETEIAGLADTTIVVLVPEAGDEIQNMKAGLMEIADIFVVNKSDRPDADRFVKNLLAMLAMSFKTKQKKPPVIKAVATEKKGIDALMENIQKHALSEISSTNKYALLAEKAYWLIKQKRMKDVNVQQLREKIQALSLANEFNLYKFIENY